MLCLVNITNREMLMKITEILSHLLALLSVGEMKMRRPCLWIHMML